MPAMMAQEAVAAKETASSPIVARRFVFCNGSREIDVGELAIAPGLGFRGLQILVSDRIGVPAEQISLFLVQQWKKARPLLEAGKRTAIDERADFASLLRENDGVVVAALKQGKKDRRGKAGRSLVVADTLEAKPSQPTPEKTILKRPTEFHRGIPAAAPLIAGENGQGLMGPFNYGALRNLQQQRERYLLSTAPAALHPYSGPAAAPPPRADGAAAAVCEVCSSIFDVTAGVPFHCCVHDKVLVEAFRSPAGPIRRPPPKAGNALLPAS